MTTNPTTKCGDGLEHEERKKSGGHEGLLTKNPRRDVLGTLIE